MNTIFNDTQRENLIKRIGLLTETKTPRWGKMNVCQMLEHLNLTNEYFLGKDGKKGKQSFWGKILGKIVLKRLTGEKPMPINLPTMKNYKAQETSSDFDFQKNKCIGLVKDFEHFNNDDFIHDFFGKITREQVGILAYKHCDHHLRQFGV
ncbi:DUF1569 domain-containing protein [Capnocytophaga felis]|uniref:DUF1569 domain-containing protein n=1 Tax=Capnocytophaga felis TaxID=2267611 RepID=A0A5M4BBP3_9FLAO|nr:DUF1569 domain-containing protein [Capnocytophaga felis]GET46667.1 hypothetical protein RCZ01_19690 [Capnocytophaga felis]GET48769.1 hypothetical protein RCZ02_16000 [Capnocytophaga felis]